MNIISWNVNSIRARVENFIAVAEQYNPDVFLLQEIRVEDHAFPFDAFDSLGYNIKIRGQKSFNGVAIFSKFPIEEVDIGVVPEEARYLQAFTGGIFVASVYVPNGQEVGVPQYFHKLDFLEKLRQRMAAMQNEIFVVGGDFNVAPYPCDVYIENYTDITASPPERDAVARIRMLNYKDVLETCGHTWWSYRQRGFKPDRGFRIDHFYLSPKAQEQFIDGGVLIDVRQQQRPSDHAPIICRLK